MKPDRVESINSLSDAKPVELEQGVVFWPLVGAHNQARNLTTGIVTIDPGASLAYHLHCFGESITLLSGQIVTEVEGRRYTLGPLDNLFIHEGTAHSTSNPSSHVQAIIHIAMSIATLSRTSVDTFFSKRAMPLGSPGQAGRERANWFARAERYEPNRGTTFHDFINKSLGSGAMSGGYGRFEPGGQLPCHAHDFDESITIIEGEATCVVEGKRYKLSGNTTAMLPRGRCHYFINETAEPMAMIWYYAGPMPQRMVLDEQCCSMKCR